jgi:hypothetical protein
MLALATAAIDFGYPWWLSYGHLPVLIAAVVIAKFWEEATQAGTSRLSVNLVATALCEKRL